MDIVCLQEPPRERKGFEIRHTEYEIRNRKRVWMAMHKGGSLAVEEQMDLSNGCNDDIIVTDIWRREEKVTRTVNGYDQKDTVKRETSPESKMVVNHLARRHRAHWRLQCPQQTMGSRMH